ncbi:MAG: glycosyltransferase family 2 protein [Lachnospiraceae bacterium]
MEKAMVDILIPVYKPDATFRLLLQRLQEQTFPVHKIILMNTEEVYWEKFKNRPEVKLVLQNMKIPYEIHHIRKEEFDHGATRRKAVACSDTEIFLFMTQDAVPADRTLIEKLVAPFLDKEGRLRMDQTNLPTIAASYARQIPNKNCSETEKYTRSFNYPDISKRKTAEDIGRLGIKTFFCSNVCAAYRRDVYDILHGFPHQAIFNEDMIFAGKAIQNGYAIAYQADAKVIHSHNYTGRQQFHRNFDLAVSQKQHPEIFDGIRSESEGIRLVKMTAKHLLTIHKPWLIVDLIVKSAWKYLGYQLGMHYEHLSRNQILRCTSNQAFWMRYWKQQK